ncbi:sensor histidine kinase [Xanthomonas campestris]|uniref:sensor histidine kinase n=1 Tax=Xanthomonas campestris TaxID=339 RepID=UPI001374C32D|nr:two-component regulator propeller domain-containing protein [Xanthomonas campestris]
MTFLLGLGLCASSEVLGQQASFVVDRYRVDTWRSQGEIKLAFTSNLVQTRDGYLWLSSQSGLLRFDGYRFKAFTADNSPALRGRIRLITIPLAEDRNGGLWVGSGSGVFMLTAGTLHSVTTNESFKSDIVNVAAVDGHNRLWAVTRSGRIFVIDQEGRQQEVNGTVISYAGSSMSIDNGGDIWIAAGEDAVYRVHNGALTKVNFPGGASLGNTSRVYAARDGSVWFGTESAVFRLSQGRLRRFALPPTEGRGSVSVITEGADGTLWIGTHGAGLHWFDGSRFQSFSRKDGLSDDRVIDILPDRQGNVWVATRDGLNRFQPLPFSSYTTYSGLPVEMPGGMTRDTTGGAWLAPPTGGVFFGKINAKGALFNRVDRIGGDFVTAMTSARQGGVWIGQPDGTVMRLAEGKRTADAVFKGLPPVTDLVEDASGKLWIATWRGLYRASGSQLTRVEQHGRWRDEYLLRLFEDTRGTIWGAGLTGISRVDAAGKITFVPWPEHVAVRANVLFEVAGGAIWAGSEEGLVRVSGGRLAVVTARQGLPASWVGAAESDASGHLWLGQLGGITRLDIDELEAVADGELDQLKDVASYKALDGLPGGDPAAWPHPWSYKDQSGKLWFAMGHGIVKIDPADAIMPVFSPKVLIDEAAIDDVSQSDPRQLTLDAGARRIDFTYTGVDLSHGPDIRFRYRLDGFDPDWVDAGTQRMASYTRLAPGSYRFRVSARDLQGQWTAADASIDVVVLAPFYLQAWFLLTSVLTIVAVLWFYLRTISRTRTVAIHDERTRLARDIHDSVLQGFGGIALQLHAVTQSVAPHTDERPHLERILTLIDRTLTRARKAVWDIRQPHELGDLAAAIYASAHQIFAETDTSVALELVGRVRHLHPDATSECVRIVEEALTNVRKHAHAAHVGIKLAYTWNHLQISVHDDGCGFDAEQLPNRSGHWGLQGIRERAQRVKARVSISACPGTGTEIALRVPLMRWLSWPLHLLDHSVRRQVP